MVENSFHHLLTSSYSLYISKNYLLELVLFFLRKFYNVNLKKSISEDQWLNGDNKMFEKIYKILHVHTKLITPDIKIVMIEKSPSLILLNKK